jgi:hypothetical protein
MKLRQQKKRPAKGAPSGFIISVLAHAGIVVAAGFITMITIIRPEPPVFVAERAPERPPINPEKPIIRISHKPKPQAMARLVANVPRDRLPQFRLPAVPGVGDDILGSGQIGNGLELDLPVIPPSVIGVHETEAAGNSLTVNFYNLNRRRNGTRRGMDYTEYCAILRDFVASDWDISKLNRFYRSPNRLRATTIMIPITSSFLGPAAFGENINEGYCWVVHYKGQLVHKEGLTFRFWGAADDVLTVRVDGRVVLAANYAWTGVDAHTIAGDWSSKAPNNRIFRLGNQKMAGGDWITLEPGVPLEMEAIAGEGPGGEFHAQLLVEVRGEDYPINDRGAPIYPIFAMEKPSWSLQDAILENLFEGEANVTEVTTVFNDYQKTEEERAL